jgi:hypothetical protein
MSPRLFHGQQQEKIAAIGLQYIICKHDFDVHIEQLVFYGVELKFDSSENLKNFISQFDKLNNAQLRVSHSSYSRIGHLTNNNDSICAVKIKMNSAAYLLARANNDVVIDGEIICNELDKKVNLADAIVLDYDFHNQIFISMKDTNTQEEDYSDAPGYLKCPISQNLMKDPITLSNGITYDRVPLINRFIHNGSYHSLICPLTNIEIGVDQLNFKTNILINGLINAYKEQKKAMKINDRNNECNDQIEVEGITTLKI